ncbi:MAG: class 1 fructose-bisphosphatase [Devosiaceae bacterium]|nr:class 1 fructose-bisphosphatase [Devosiaceae bacterium]
MSISSKNDQNTDLAFWLKNQNASSALSQIVLAMAEAGIEIAHVAKSAALDGKSGAAGIVNVQGEEQKDLDIISNDIVLEHLKKCPSAIALVSEEVPELLINPGGEISSDDEKNYAICFDPLDGSSNIETNSAIGTIFSVLQLGVINGDYPDQNDVFAASKNQIAAGYIYYGPATLLILTIGKSVAMFAFSEVDKQFFLVQDQLTIPKTASEYSINMAYARFWDASTTTYINDCQSGKPGPRGKDFNMRWSGAMIADVHKLFVRGGVFIYPALKKPGSETGKLRFLYEALPMAMLVENAGGKAIMGKQEISGFLPSSLHQRVPVILGSKEEVEILQNLYRQKH